MAKSSTSYAKGKKRPEQGGAREGAGAKTKKQIEVKKTVDELVQAFLEDNVLPVLGSYKKLTEIREVRHYDKDGNLLFTEEIIDGATVRHWVDKFKAAARQEIDIQTHGTVIVKTNVNPHKGQEKKEGGGSSGKD